MKKKHVSKMSVDEIMKAIMSDYIAGFSLKKSSKYMEILVCNI